MSSSLNLYPRCLTHLTLVLALAFQQPQGGWQRHQGPTAPYRLLHKAQTHGSQEWEEAESNCGPARDLWGRGS